MRKVREELQQLYRQEQWRRSGKKKDRVKLKETITIDGFLSFTPLLNANVFFCRFYSNLTLFMTKLRVLVLSFPYFTDISNASSYLSSYSHLGGHGISPHRHLERVVIPINQIRNNRSFIYFFKNLAHHNKVFANFRHSQESMDIILAFGPLLFMILLIGCGGTSKVFFL